MLQRWCDVDNFVYELHKGDPVKLVGKQGNYRFLSYWYYMNKIIDPPEYAEIVGPIGGDGENAKVVALWKIRRPAKNVTRRTVAPNLLGIEISQKAHAHARKG